MYEPLAGRMLRKKIEAIEPLKRLSCHNILFVDWHKETQQLLATVFGEYSLEVARFKKIRFKPRSAEGFSDTRTPKEVFLHGLEQAKALLLDAVGKVES